MLERCTFTTRYVELHETDAILVCVPTPLTRNREPDLGPLLSAAQALAGVIRRGQTVILESTTFPGTTREHMVPLLEESGLRAGEDFALAFSPERVDPGRTDYTLRNTPKVVGGLTPACTEAAVAVYAPVCDEIVRVSTPEVAELSKLLENIFRSVNIALVNEMAMLADRMGIDIWEVVDAAATKPYGFMPLRARARAWAATACPVDPFYLTWKAREYDLSTEFIELAGKVNQQMPYFCLEKAERALNDAGKPVKGARILIVGVSYKARRGRHARVTGAEDHPAAARARRRRSPTTTRTCRSCPTSGCAAPSCRRRPTAWTWRSSSPPTRPSITARSPSAPS